MEQVHDALEAVVGHRAGNEQPLMETGLDSLGNHLSFLPTESQYQDIYSQTSERVCHGCALHSSNFWRQTSSSTRLELSVQFATNLTVGLGMTGHQQPRKLCIGNYCRGYTVHWYPILLNEACATSPCGICQSSAVHLDDKIVSLHIPDTLAELLHLKPKLLILYRCSRAAQLIDKQIQHGPTVHCHIWLSISTSIDYFHCKQIKCCSQCWVR